ncbi:MAG: class II aldolase/adducin family protein [Rhodospirillales bacterium]|nr:class II aldolase/adducin family protein [Rhodospirillales bacterium]MCC7167028.1 class II aldolase/adducin family protein [Rhodospirillales bacterium]
MSTEKSVELALRDLVIANRILAREGVLDAFGHVSIRHPTEAGRYFMARSRAPELVSREDLIEFNLDSSPINQNGRAMYAERQIHGCIYQLRPEVMAVCHNHAHSLVPFGVTGSLIKPIFHMASVIGEEVPIWDIREEFGDTNLLVTDAPKGLALARSLGARRAALMRGHGSVVVGQTLRQAVFTAIYLQQNAELILRARELGPITYLSPGEVKAASDLLFQPLSQDRSWEYWATRAGFSGI